MHTRREPGNEVGEDGCRGWLFLCGCVYEREREKHGVSFRTRSLSETDYVMAKWSREGEGGQNKTGREGDRTMHGLSVILCQNFSLTLFSVICHFSQTYLVISYQTGSTVTLLGQ